MNVNLSELFLMLFKIYDYIKEIVMIIIKILEVFNFMVVFFILNFVVRL